MPEDPIPYREGDPPPSPRHVPADLKDVDGNAIGTYWISLDDIDSSSMPMKHESLTTMEGSIARWVWRHMKDHVTHCRSFEDWERGFLAESDPAQEIMLWCRATYAYLQFLNEKPDSQRAAVYDAVMKIMMGRTDLVSAPSVGRKLEKMMRATIPLNFSAFTEDGRYPAGPPHLE